MMMSEQSVLGKRKAKTATKAKQVKQERCDPVAALLHPVPVIIHPTKPTAKVCSDFIEGFKNLGSEDRIAAQLPCLHVVHLIRGNTIVAAKHVSFGLHPARCPPCIGATQTVALAQGADGCEWMGTDGPKDELMRSARALVRDGGLDASVEQPALQSSTKALSGNDLMVRSLRSNHTHAHVPTHHAHKSSFQGAGRERRL